MRRGYVLKKTLSVKRLLMLRPFHCIPLPSFPGIHNDVTYTACLKVPKIRLASLRSPFGIARLAVN